MSQAIDRIREYQRDCAEHKSMKGSLSREEAMVYARLHGIPEEQAPALWDREVEMPMSSSTARSDDWARKGMPRRPRRR